MSSNKLFYKKQFGFQKKCSTEHAILDLVEQITSSFGKNNFTLGVFIDLSKAFDTINHEILLTKLDHGVRGKTYKWIKSYLTNRKQFAIQKDAGLLDSALLFLIYINDMYKASNSIMTIMFADDTNFFLSHKNIKQMFSKMNTELNKFNDWFKANKLSPNTGKTKFTLFHKASQSENIPLKLPTLIMNNIILKQKDSLKFLGVLIDETLSWKNHINVLESKLASAIGLLYRSRRFLNLSSRLLLYNSLVHSHLSYANIAWGSTHPTKLQKLASKQKHICKIIKFKGRIDSALPIKTSKY